MTNDDRALREKAERRLAARKAPGLEQRPEETLGLVHELEVRQIEMELQNEELWRTRDELEASREKYFDLYDLAPVGYAVLNDKGLLLEANLTLTGRLGVPRTALIGRPFSRFVDSASQETYDLHLRRLFETGKPSSFEVRMVTEEGAPFRGRIDSVVHDDLFSGSRSCRVALTDVTERKEAEEALRANRALLREILDSVPQAIFWKDRASVYLGCNQPFARWVGLAGPEQVVGKSDFDLSGRREEADAQRADDERVMGSGVPKRHVAARGLSDGTERWVETTKVPMLDARGEAQGILGVFEDITGRRHAERMREAAYRISEAASGTRSLDDFFDRAHAIFGEVVQARNFYVALLDPAKEVLEFPYFVDEFDPAPAPKPVGRGLTEFVIRTGKPLLASREDLENLVARREVEVHGTFPSSWLGSPLEVSGVTIGAVVVQTYTTEARFSRPDMDFLSFLSGEMATAIDRKRAEQELQTLHAELERRVVERTAELAEANRELETYSYSVAHELRAPLRAIDGHSALIARDHGGQLDDDGRRHFGQVRWNAQRMGHLIDDLLSFSRAGRADLTFGSVDMTEAAKKAFTQVVADPAFLSRVAFSVGVLPEATGDAGLLNTVWENLLSNAVKFSSGQERPEIVVEGKVEGDEAIYRVRDNGVGFDMKFVDKLFGVFHRLHAIHEFEGTGVGLALGRRIVVRHGGRIWAEGELGRGAIFSFWLPVKPPSGVSASRRKLVLPPGTSKGS